ncbi:DUF1657 domain-containing protein [Numidum massiliense]|uniref:DUF1657 domain-containing protein n=1 Tax=Numidum massiliense TaxID=1522315 RepID=UPI0006D5679E|nr:DUF1657 domain-containing protein [Numidum massiliense]
MTIHTKLKQVLVQAKTVAVQLEQFALDTDDRQIQQLYHVLARQSDDVASVLQTRILAVESEEPTY